MEVGENICISVCDKGVVSMTKSLVIGKHTKNSKAHELTRKNLARCLPVSCVHNHEMCISVSHQENASPITDYYQDILTRKARIGKTKQIQARMWNM